ncbi:MAG: nicotinamide-nucleotide amidohydrolase family protein [Johnsonella sp.]|nr:nicotinamide-nucleotide amidohydrolase family protein [Johnsonella sp.]
MIKRRKTIKLHRIAKEEVEKAIGALLQKENPLLQLKESGGEIHIIVKAEAETEEEAKTMLKEIAKDLKKTFADYIDTVKETETLEKTLIKLLEKHELTVATAESCTGGLLAARMINVPGVSDVFKEGFITYTNKSKRKRLDVAKSTLKKYGAVSRQTAKEMAMGTALNADTDTAVAVTGIAGPDGGSEEKPVGLVYIAAYVSGDIAVEEHRFSGDRQTIRAEAAEAALLLLKTLVADKYS